MILYSWVTTSELQPPHITTKSNPGHCFFSPFFFDKTVSKSRKIADFNFERGLQNQELGPKGSKKSSQIQGLAHIVVWIPSSLGSRFWFCSMWFCHFYPGFRFVLYKMGNPWYIWNKPGDLRISSWHRFRSREKSCQDRGGKHFIAIRVLINGGRNLFRSFNILSAHPKGQTARKLSVRLHESWMCVALPCLGQRRRRSGIGN